VDARVKSGHDDFVEFQIKFQTAKEFSRRDAPGVLQLRSPPKSEGAGKTGWALHPRSRVRFASKSMHTSILVQRKHSGLVWLTGRLMPDFKTIADFRKDNGEAIRKVGREFVVLCRRLELFSEASVAIDGSKFKAVNTRDRNFTHAKMQRRLAQIDNAARLKTTAA
jgi:hypothetical protein